MCGLINKKILVFFQGANQNLIVAHLFYCYVFYFKKYFWTIFKVYWICYNIASVLVLIFWQGIWDLSGGASGKEPTSQCRRHLILGFDPWVRKIPWRRAWQSTPVFLPGESYGQKSLATVHGITKSRTWLSTHTHLDPVWGQPDFKSSLMSWSCASWKRISRHEAEWEENSLLEQKTLLEQWAGSRESWGFCG